MDTRRDKSPGDLAAGDCAPRDLLHTENLPDTQKILAIGRNRPEQSDLCIRVCEEMDLEDFEDCATDPPITLAVLTALYGTAAWSADALTDATTTASADEADTLQEVTVTATRREASAQDLPMSITAVSGAQLESAGIQDVASLARSMAGINYTDKGPLATSMARRSSSAASTAKLLPASWRWPRPSCRRLPPTSMTHRCT